MKCVLSFSHRNAVPESEFLINKKLLGIHETATYKDAIVAQRLSKFKRVSGCTYTFI